MNAHRKNLVAATGPGKSAPSEIARFGLVLLLLAAVLFGLLPLLVGTLPYWLRVFTNVCLLSFASLGVWLTFSIGRVNIAQGAFALIGGYAVGIATFPLFYYPFYFMVRGARAARRARIEHKVHKEAREVTGQAE